MKGGGSKVKLADSSLSSLSKIFSNVSFHHNDAHTFEPELYAGCTFMPLIIADHSDILRACLWSNLEIRVLYACCTVSLAPRWMEKVETNTSLIK